MNPKDFDWDDSQQVTVTNPTGELFKFKVHNKDYEVGAGATVKMPGFMAWVYVYGIASQICQADKLFSRWNEEGFRKQYYDRVFVGADEVMQQVVMENVIEDATDLGVGDLDSEDPAQKEVRRGRPAKA